MQNSGAWIGLTKKRNTVTKLLYGLQPNLKLNIHPSLRYLPGQSDPMNLHTDMSFLEPWAESSQHPCLLVDATRAGLH